MKKIKLGTDCGRQSPQQATLSYMVLTNLIPQGGKNSQLNCMEIGGSSRLSVSYVVSEFCSNIYLPAEFSLQPVQLYICVYFIAYFIFPWFFCFPQPDSLGCYFWQWDAGFGLMTPQGFSCSVFCRGSPQNPLKPAGSEQTLLTCDLTTAFLWRCTTPSAIFVTNSYLLKSDNARHKYQASSGFKRAIVQRDVEG